MYEQAASPSTSRFGPVSIQSSSCIEEATQPCPPHPQIPGSTVKVVIDATLFRNATAYINAPDGYAPAPALSRRRCPPCLAA